MNERGQLIRHGVRGWLQDHAEPLTEAMAVDDFLAEGRDGTGLKTRVPWVRIASRAQSKRATEGFYVVYLFAADGDVVYLSLNQGTTDFINGEFVAKSPGVIESRVTWARQTLVDWLPRAGGHASVQLQDPGLGAGYERGNIVARAYRRGFVPDDDTLLADLRFFSEGLGLLYKARVIRPLPSERPEIAEAEDVAIEATGRPRPSSRAGFRTNAKEIKVVEDHAVKLARTYYERDGWVVKELGKPFDLEVRRGSEHLDVEVKGTTSDGAGVPLTAGEVRHHEKVYPDNALVVVRNIVLDRRSDPPTVSDGTLYELRHWRIDPSDLAVISYSYDVPGEIYEQPGVHADTWRPPKPPTPARFW